eukprot:GDKI01047224.1.p1 GENE.GDKI01047224.1~~GDKI01047224.1.p1  ORF type:complete len:110 (-),score=24.56 GDKI01047224.1:62-391(-)
MATSQNITALDDDETHVTVTIRDSNGFTIHLRVRWDTPMWRLMAKYSDKTKQERGSLRFFLDGQQVNEYDTAHSLKWQRGDVVSVMLPSIGGGTSSVSSVCSVCCTAYM